MSFKDQSLVDQPSISHDLEGGGQLWGIPMADTVASNRGKSV